MDIFLIIVCIVVALLLCVVNVYIMAFYSHVDDKNTCTVVFCKVVVVLTLLQCQLQELLLALDASNSRGTGAGFDMALLWEIFYLSVWSNLGFLLPLSVFLYESDDEKSACERVSITICELIITLGMVCVLTFVSYIYLNTASIPIELVTTVVSSAASLQSSTVTDDIVTATIASQSTVDIGIGIPYYIMGLMCFFGYFVLALCGGCGLTALPLDLIMQFRMRPRWRRTSEANAKKLELRQIIQGLVKTGEHLKKKMRQADYETGWWSKRKYNANISQQFSQYQAMVMENKDHYDLFKLELQMQNTNPLVFIGKLILGIFSIFLTFVWWFQILFSQLVLVNGRPLTYMVDTLLLYFESNNASFAGVIFFMIMTQYLVLCILKGSFAFGLQIPYVFSFHPMGQGKTWMNSFLFNLAISVLGSTAICHLCAGCFPQYLRNTDIQVILINQVNYLKFFNIFFKNKVFIYIILVKCIITQIWSALISIFIIIRGVRKPDLLKLIQEKRKKLKMKPMEVEMQQLSHEPKKGKKTELPPKSNKGKSHISSKSGSKVTVVGKGKK